MGGTDLIRWLFLKKLKSARTFKAKEVLLSPSKKQINMLWTPMEGKRKGAQRCWEQALASSQLGNGTSLQHLQGAALWQNQSLEEDSASDELTDLADTLISD